MDEINKIRAQIEANLKAIEGQIYEIESRYLDATMPTGNIVKGWEGYLDSRPRSVHYKRDKKLKPTDRVFSYSSTSAPIPAEDFEKEETNETLISPQSKVPEDVKSSRSSRRKKRKRRFHGGDTR